MTWALSYLKEERVTNFICHVSYAEVLECIELNAAGIDVGNSSHFIVVPQDRETEIVKEFASFTEDPHLRYMEY